MPKVIKKRPAKRKPVQESEVRSVALKAFDAIKERQKQIIIGISVILGIVIIFTVISIYSTSQYKKAYSLEREGYNYYYGQNIDNTIPEKERLNKALELYKSSLDIRMTPTALYYLGNTYFKLGDYVNAIQKYLRFIDKYSQETEILPLVYQKLASSYFMTEQNDKALETLDELANLENGIFMDTALMLEARHYERAGQNEKALDIYKELISLFPNSPWSAEARAKITPKGKAEESTEEATEETITDEGTAN